MFSNCQIWLNHFMDDYHHWSNIRKFIKKNNLRSFLNLENLFLVKFHE
jgi:hypothetical protein